MQIPPLSIALFLGFFPLLLQAQRPALNARSAALAGITAGLSDDYAGSINPAGLVRTGKPIFFLQSDIKYGLKALKHLGLGASLSAGPQGRLGLSLFSHGFEGQNNHKICVSYGRKLSETVNIGAEMGYLWQNSPDFSWQARPWLSVGAHYRLTAAWQFGAWLQQPLQLWVQQTSNTATVCLSARYAPQESLQFWLGCDKNSLEPWLFRAALEVAFNTLFRLRVGLSLPYWQFSAGFGWQFSTHYDLDLSLAQHSILGSTPTLSLKRHL